MHVWHFSEKCECFVCLRLSYLSCEYVSDVCEQDVWSCVCVCVLHNNTSMRQHLPDQGGPSVRLAVERSQLRAIFGLRCHVNKEIHANWWNRSWGWYGKQLPEQQGTGGKVGWGGGEGPQNSQFWACWKVGGLLAVAHCLFVYSHWLSAGPYANQLIFKLRRCNLIVSLSTANYLPAPAVDIQISWS